MDLRFFRHLAGKTQRELGRRVGSCQSQIHLIEAGYAFPSQEQKAKIAAALGVSVDEIDWPQKLLKEEQPV